LEMYHNRRGLALVWLFSFYCRTGESWGKAEPIGVRESASAQLQLPDGASAGGQRLGVRAAPRLGVIVRGEPFRLGGQYSRQSCAPQALIPQLSIAQSHVRHILTPYAAAGFTVEVFMAGYECDGEDGRNMMAQLQHVYRPFLVHIDLLKRQPPCHSRCNRTFGTNDQHSNFVTGLEALTKFSAHQGAPDLTLAIRVDMNFTVNLEPLLSSVTSPEKLYIPWYTRAPEWWSPDADIADSMFMVPQNTFNGFACSVCEPTTCFGTCEGSTGASCEANDQSGHRCTLEFSKRGVPFDFLFASTVGIWDSDPAKHNQFTVKGQPFEEKGNPLYTLPLRMPPFSIGDGGGQEATGLQADSDLESEWTAMANAMVNPALLKQLLPLNFLESLQDRRIRETARNRWRDRCNAAFACNMKARPLPTEAAPNFAKRGREIKEMHKRLMGARHQLKLRALTTEEQRALLQLYTTDLGAEELEAYDDLSKTRAPVARPPETAASIASAQALSSLLYGIHRPTAK
jgi:hypothetical protein